VTSFASLETPEAWQRPRLAPRPERLERPVETLPGVGQAVRRKLARLGLCTVGDLILTAPFRHVGARPISSLFGEDEEVAIEVEVRRLSKRRARGRMTIVEATVADDSGSIKAVWFNQPWVAEQLEPGARVRLIGTVRRGTFGVRSHEREGAPRQEPLVPVYRASEEITPKKIRELVGAALEFAHDVVDPLPAELKTRRELPLRADALVALHRPRSLADAEQARARLAFDELLLLQVGLARRRAERVDDVAPALAPPGDLVARYRQLLPFALTPDQERAVSEIDADLVRETPMERLLQGDVGRGRRSSRSMRSSGRWNQAGSAR
jgi:ATP-dependent DNA helicase RecG